MCGFSSFVVSRLLPAFNFTLGSVSMACLFFRVFVGVLLGAPKNPHHHHQQHYNNTPRTLGPRQNRQEEAAARVRARPLPPPTQGFYPQPSDRPLTETSEFVLSSQARHERAAQEFRDRVRKEEERARRAREVGWVVSRLGRHLRR